MKITNNYTLSNQGAFQGKINPELVKKLANPDREINLQIIKDGFEKRKKEVSGEVSKELREALKRDMLQTMKLYAEYFANEYLAKNFPEHFPKK